MTAQQQEWKAKWIWNDGEASPRNEWWCFRRTFAVPDEGWDSASLRITADSRYVLYVNGVRAGRGPVRSWPQEQFYDTYEIGHLLRAGEANTISVLVIHFGVSNFYYLRGRGGLVAELDLLNDGASVWKLCTDSNWLTARHLGQDERSQRMSCQQGFAERIDARLWDLEWMRPDYDDSGWQRALELGPVGMEPWTKLIPRDIPHLTEEPVYPVRIESLRSVAPPTWTAVVDMRNQMVPDSVNHANPVTFAGYLGTMVRTPQATKAKIGFPSGLPNGTCILNGVRLPDDRYSGVHPERYAEIELRQGDNLLLFDISGWDHGHGFHVGFYCETPFEVLSPVAASEEDSEFFAIGPFDAVAVIDHQPTRPLSYDRELKNRAGQIADASGLEAFREWVRPVPKKLVGRDDIFALSVWKVESDPQPVPLALQNSVIAHSVPGIVPKFAGRDTELIIDFGRELSGYISFEVEAPAGAVLDWYGFEYMRDGWRQDTFGLDNTVRYVARAGRQSYTSPVRRGLRYLMLTVRNADKPVKLHRVQMIQSNFPVAEIGRFQSSDALLNDIWEISKHTTRLCMEDTFVDCPSYEQVFWVGDSRNEAIVNYYVFGADEIVRRCLKLVPGSRTETPLYMDQVPSGWSSVIPNWTFFWAIACREYYEHTGDRSFAAEMWPHVRYTLDHYLQRIDERGLLNIRGWNLLDWAPIDQPNNGVVTHQNAFLVKTLRSAAALAEAAGQAEEGKSYVEAADRLQAAINEHLWSEERQAYYDCIHADGRYSSTFSMQTQVVAYLCGIAQGERKALMEQYLVDPVKDFVQIGSPFMSFFYYEALAQVGQFDRMLADIRQNYGQMIQYDATTCWEMYPNSGINRANPNLLTRSHCHAWSAAPGYFLSAFVLGVRSAAPGWTKVVVEPNPCDLSWARGTVPLPNAGRIDVSWTVSETAEGRSIDIRVAAPRGLDVAIRPPAGYKATVSRHDLP
jgi:hypothetical protein